MKRAEVVVDMDPATADRAGTTTAVVKRLAARSYSLGASASIGGPAAAHPKTLRVRVPLTEAQEAIPEIQQMPGVLDARIGIIDDYPPDDEPPSGVREPRRPLPPTGDQAQALYEP